MAESPQFQGPDGVFRRDYVQSTTVAHHFFSGSTPSDTVDMQVSIRGAAFSSDPDNIAFNGSTFVVPNPSAYPEGLQLLTGSNEIKVRSILSTGSITQEARVLVNLSSEGDLGEVPVAPTGIYLERFNSTVKITVEGIVNNAAVVGYHFYASSQPGGGSIGYFRINPSIVISGDTAEVTSEPATLSVDADVVLDNEGFHAADPIYFRLRGSQEDQDDTELGVSFDELVRISETTNKIRIETTVMSVRETRQYSFEHDRHATLQSEIPALPHADLSVVPESDPLYYVATAVHLINGVEYESFFSPEVAGMPLRILPVVGAFPQVSRQQMLRKAVLSIYRSQPQVRVDPGSALRDTFLDPFATEADRIRFIIDFLHNAQSFATLLTIDDPTLSGASVPVGQSSYKTALREAFHLTTNEQVQQIVDNAFDKLASNHGVVRDGGKRARGEVTFSVQGRPTTSIVKSIGTLLSGGGMAFRTTSTAVINPGGVGRNFNPRTGRYYGRAYVQANEPGSAGNLSAGQITAISNNTMQVQVINESSTFGGSDRESNRDIATRALRVLSSVDSGTLQGYAKTAISTPGVAQVSVIQSGDPLMMRDRNNSGQHVGGKVDVYLRGVSLARVSDTFAFSFETRRRQQFEPVGDLASLRFRAIDPALNADNPIIEMLGLPNIGLVFENATKSYEFNLSNVQYVGHNEIQLDSELNDPALHDLLDEFRGSYRYRTSNKFVLTRQPVAEVIRFTGQQTGLLTEDIYDLFRASDPLDVGRSTMAGDYVRVTQPLGNNVTIPSSTPITITGEVHTILDGIEYVNRLGANFLTVRVFSSDRTVEYNGPLSSDAQRDFTIIFGDETTPLGILLTDASSISAGQSIQVDYAHDENFVLEYMSNAVVSAVQDNINRQSHITADVVAKWAVEVPVDITATLVLLRNTVADEVDGAVRTALARLFGMFGLGVPVRQSDVIRALDAVSGVDYVVTPLTKMVRGNGAQVIRETVETDTSSDFELISSWSSPTVSAYLLKNPLSSATVDAGGERKNFRGVFQDDAVLLHHEMQPNVNGFPLRGSSGGCFVIGNLGMNIPGYSDRDTIAAGYVLPANNDEREAEILRIRKVLTANRVLVSVAPGDQPDSHQYAVTYVVHSDVGVKNIDPGPIEYLVLGDLNFVYDEVS